MTDIALTPIEEFLLIWLSREQFSQLGECHGRTLDLLVERGLAQIHKPGEHQRFIFNDYAGKEEMCRAVSLTEAGRAARASIKGDQHHG